MEKLWRWERMQIAPWPMPVIDGTGKYVTPGLIDVHSHIGDLPGARG
jgi:imidazolonepropionase-like amidohydrolase